MTPSSATAKASGAASTSSSSTVASGAANATTPCGDSVRALRATCSTSTRRTGTPASPASSAISSRISATTGVGRHPDVVHDPGAGHEELAHGPSSFDLLPQIALLAARGPGAVASLVAVVTTVAPTAIPATVLVASRRPLRAPVIAGRVIGARTYCAARPRA